MRPLTFEGFLTAYVKRLSYNHSLDLHRLACECEKENPRLLQPLVLYAVYCKKDLTARRQFLGTTVYDEYCRFVAVRPSENEMTKDYRKIYKSYRRVKNKPVTEAELKEKMLFEIRQWQQRQKVTGYAILKSTTGYNKGNLYSFLRGNVNALSFEKADFLLRHLEKQFPENAGEPRESH